MSKDFEIRFPPRPSMIGKIVWNTERTTFGSRIFSIRSIEKHICGQCKVILEEFVSTPDCRTISAFLTDGQTTSVMWSHRGNNRSMAEGGLLAGGNATAEG